MRTPISPWPITGHFGDKSFQSITCTGTFNIVTFSNKESKQTLHFNGHFYSVMLCERAVFAVARCPSVCHVRVL